ncbi:unnamed protein product [Cuscuta epithymum]|uniref:GAG-pre-integrase domain-containing protein n=1 Tax=Cuscuta epithymum TaxID=186058 RepID=A0AAV0CLQ2_9ASTE|nr:unnamed protein product [Cuscuta epithymum]
MVELWHQRLGHPSSQVIEKLAPVSGLKHTRGLPCDVCFRAKQTRDSFPTSLNKTHEPFELVHCDLWGPYNTPSSCGARHFLTIVDDYSRAVWVYLLLDKKEVFKMFLSFVAMVDRQFSKRIITVLLSLIQHDIVNICINVYEQLSFYVETRKGENHGTF